MLRLISWNVAGRPVNAGRQAEVLAAGRPDLVALQEVWFGTLAGWPHRLAGEGAHILDS